MDTLATAISIILYLLLLVLFGFFVFWIVRFLTQVPRYPKRIAEALEQLADK
jgi:hypothetical protein